MTLECEVKERDKHDKVPDVQRAGGRIDAHIDGALVIQQMLVSWAMSPRFSSS